jgi:hypothetical protein
MDLQPGYYWVDNGDKEPEPALWDGTAWALLGVGHADLENLAASSEMTSRSRFSVRLGRFIALPADAQSDKH